jgi:hypothetical protein
MANIQIAGKTISLTPYQSGGGGIVWRCGWSDAPVGGGAELELMGANSNNSSAYEEPTIEEQYVPGNCRS